MMVALAIVLALIIVGLVVWDRRIRGPAPASSEPGAPLGSRFRPAPRAAPGAGAPNSRPRFQGRGVATAGPAGGPARQGSPVVPRAAANRRFSGEVRRSPDAIGLACGRPIAECERGADCLCVD